MYKLQIIFNLVQKFWRAPTYWNYVNEIEPNITYVDK